MSLKFSVNCFICFSKSRIFQYFKKDFLNFVLLFTLTLCYLTFPPSFPIFDQQRQRNKKTKAQNLSSSVFTTWILQQTARFRGCDTVLPASALSYFFPHCLFQFFFYFRSWGHQKSDSIHKIHETKFTTTQEQSQTNELLVNAEFCKMSNTPQISHSITIKFYSQRVQT